METVTFTCALPMYGSNDAAVLADLKDYCTANGLNAIVVSGGANRDMMLVQISDSGEPAAFERLRSYIELQYKDMVL